MKRFFLALLLCTLATPVFAACPASLELKDANGVLAAGKYVDDGSGLCQVVVVPALNTASGWTPSTKTALTNSAVSVKASAGQLGFAQCDNQNSSYAYVQIFNVASGSVSLGSTAPTQILPIPGGLSNGFVMNSVGMQYSTAISVAATTTATGSSALSITLNCTFGFN